MKFKIRLYEVVIKVALKCTEVCMKLCEVLVTRTKMKSNPEALSRELIVW